MTIKHTKHTPGPWRIGKSTPDWGTDIYHGTHYQRSHQCVCVVQSGVRGQKELKSNILLIAAAPELLEALRLIFKDLSKISPVVFDEEISELAKTRIHDVLSKLKDI